MTALEDERRPETATGEPQRPRGATPAGATPPRLHHRLLARLLRAVIWTFGALPAPVAYLGADLLAVPLWLAWSFTDRRGRRSRGYWRNARIVFRDSGLGPVRPRGHLWRFVRHLAWLAVDSCRLRRITPETVAEVIDLAEFEPLRELFREGKGVVWATAHIGVWDVAGYVCALNGIPITSVFRPSPVPGIDQLLANLRTGSGQVVVAKRNVVWTLRRALAEGRTIGLLCDSAGRHGDHFPPFLGTPAATVGTPALLSLNSGAPIVVVTAHRTGRFRFALHVWDVIRPDEVRTGDRDRDVAVILTRINDGLTKAVTLSPEQWFWQGRRFKHRPPGERPDAAGLPPSAAAVTAVAAATAGAPPPASS